MPLFSSDIQAFILFVSINSHWLLHPHLYSYKDLNKYVSNKCLRLFACKPKMYKLKANHVYKHLSYKTEMSFDLASNLSDTFLISRPPLIFQNFAN